MRVGRRTSGTYNIRMKLFIWQIEIKCLRPPKLCSYLGSYLGLAGGFIRRDSCPSVSPPDPWVKRGKEQPPTEIFPACRQCDRHEKRCSPSSLPLAARFSFRTAQKAQERRKLPAVNAAVFALRRGLDGHVGQKQRLSGPNWLIGRGFENPRASLLGDVWLLQYRAFFLD